jgi:hypothetical protein
MLERQNVMMTACKISSIQVASHDASVVNWLKTRGVTSAVIWDEDGAIVRALLPSGKAARVLKVLGRSGCGAFRALPDNLVLIDALVSHKVAERALTAIRCTA